MLSTPIPHLRVRKSAFAAQIISREGSGSGRHTFSRWRETSHLSASNSGLNNSGVLPLGDLGVCGAPPRGNHKSGPTIDLVVVNRFVSSSGLKPLSSSAVLNSMASIALRDGNCRMPSPLLCEGSILGLQLVTAAGSRCQQCV